MGKSFFWTLNVIIQIHILQVASMSWNSPFWGKFDFKNQWLDLYTNKIFCDLVFLEIVKEYSFTLVLCLKHVDINFLKNLRHDKSATSVLQVINSWYSLKDGVSTHRGDLENISLYDSINSIKKAFSHNLNVQKIVHFLKLTLEIMADTKSDELNLLWLPVWWC